MAGLIRRLAGKFSGKQKFTVRAGPCAYRDAQENGWFRHETGELVEGFPIRSNDTVLDVGCGKGGASIFAAATGAEIIAADIDPEMTKFVERKLRGSRCRAFRTVVSDTNPLPLPDETASRVVAMEVMEHVDDPAQFLSELVRVGKPGALYLIAVPDKSSETMQQVIAPPSYWEKPNHLHVFQRDELDRLIMSAGLEITKKCYTGFFWAMWWTLFWAADQEFGQPEGPILANWTRTWHSLMESQHKGRHVRKALDDFMPKSQVVIARKAA